MATNTELTLLKIYDRIIPKINIPDLTAQVDLTRRNDGSEYPTGIEITSDDCPIYVILSLFNNNNDEIINNYRWEYMDCRSGAIIESNLDYNATDEEVIAFFEHTLATNDNVIKL
jgi:hypothetical protein